MKTILAVEVGVFRKMNGESQRNLESAVLSGIPGVLYAFTPEGEMVYWNQQLKTVTGYEDEEIASMHPKAFVPMDQRSLVEEKIDEVLHEGTTSLFAQIVTKVGVRVPYHFRASRIEREGNPIICGKGRVLTTAHQKFERFFEIRSFSSSEDGEPIYGNEGTLKSARANLRFAVGALVQADVDTKAIDVDDLWVYVDAALREVDAIIGSLDEFREDPPPFEEPRLN